MDKTSSFISVASVYFFLKAPARDFVGEIWVLFGYMAPSTPSTPSCPESGMVHWLSSAYVRVACRPHELEVAGWPVALW